MNSTVCSDNAVLLLWLGLGTKPHLFRKTCFGCHKHDSKCPEDSLKTTAFHGSRCPNFLLDKTLSCLNKRGWNLSRVYFKIFFGFTLDTFAFDTDMTLHQRFAEMLNGLICFLQTGLRHNNEKQRHKPWKSFFDSEHEMLTVKSKPPEVNGKKKETLTLWKAKKI